MINSFRNEYHFLSNFYPLHIKYEGLIYYSVEHAYQAAKTLDPELRIGMSQLCSAATAKKIGRLLPLRDDWDAVKLTVMRDCLALKFTTVNFCGNRLMMTTPQELVEGNHWHDNFWGCCSCPKHKDNGTNWLGILLMERRDALWQQAPPT
jgi:ribA/ribD-fused uncharacterized protein